MTAEGERELRMRVVLAPDVIGGSFTDVSCCRVLRLWRDGRIEIAVNRVLLRRYLRMLHRLGISGKVLQWWAWWFTEQRAVFCSADDSERVFASCEALAKRTGAQTVIHAGLVPLGRDASEASVGGVTWLTCAEFLKKCGAD